MTTPQGSAPPDKTADREPEAPTPAPTMDFKPINQIPMLTPFIPRPRRILIVTSDQRRSNGLPARDLALLFVSL
ncbi:hypothetical protein GCM10027256_32680 [Novispirillum itersonii subsp. nipponicum]|uniref:PAB1-binding protein PBP1 n=1 Tax=Novispirillum itersonii TaxID=189 RepID=A0A7W9ZJ64_NOVIT|nr:PAB1-binding protein PBP1 [Novispirillum itersonii]